MQSQRVTRQRSRIGRGSARPSLQVEHLECRTQPGSILPFNEFSMMGADLFERDPLTQQLSSTELTAQRIALEESADSFSAVSFGAVSDRQVQAAPAVPVATQAAPVQTQALLLAVGSVPAATNLPLNTVPVQAEAHPVELTKLVSNAFYLESSPHVAGPTPPSLGVLSYAAADVSEANAVATNVYTGEAYVGGSIGAGVDRQAFITKYDAAGVPVWTAVFQAADPELTYVESQINGLAMDPNLGVLYAVGTARDANAGDTDQFVMQLWDDGSTAYALWSYGIGGANDDQGHGVAVDYNTYNVYLTGDFKLNPTTTHITAFGLDWLGTLPPLFGYYYTFGAEFTGSSGRGATFDLYNGNLIAVGSVEQAGQALPLALSIPGQTGQGGQGLLFENPTSGNGVFQSAAFDQTDGGILVVGSVPAPLGGTVGIAAKLTPDFAAAAWGFIYEGTKEFYGIDADFYGFAYISGTVEGPEGGDNVLVGQFDAYTGEPVPDQVVLVGGEGTDTGRRLAISYDANFLPISHVAFTTTTENFLTSDGSVYPAGAVTAAAYAALGGYF